MGFMEPKEIPVRGMSRAPEDNLSPGLILPVTFGSSEDMGIPRAGAKVVSMTCGDISHERLYYSSCPLNFREKFWKLVKVKKEK